MVCYPLNQNMVKLSGGAERIIVFCTWNCVLAGSKNKRTLWRMSCVFTFVVFIYGPAPPPGGCSPKLWRVASGFDGGELNSSINDSAELNRLISSAQALGENWKISGEARKSISMEELFLFFLFLAVIVWLFFPVLRQRHPKEVSGYFSPSFCTGFPLPILVQS